VLRGTRRPFQFESFIGVFKQTSIQSEREFETRLWRQLQKLHRLDEYPWDPAVRHDPESANFSFSVAGTAFYVVGLHPRISPVRSTYMESTNMRFPLHSIYL